MAAGAGDADHVSGFVQVESESLAVGAGRLQANVRLVCSLRVEPASELLEAACIVEKNFVFEFAVLANQANVELQLGNVNAKHRNR